MKASSKPKISRREAMDCIPLKNIQSRESRGEKGELIISYPIEVRPWLARWMRLCGGKDVVGTKKLQLDELGASVWNLLVGKRSVGQLIQDFAALQRLHPREAEVSVTAFLRELGKRGLIGLR